jgi:hypothetical protein
MSQTEYKEEQFRVKEVLEIWFNSLRRLNENLPIASIQLEHELKDWMKYGNVGGVELRGMPTLDLAIIFLGHPKPKIGIQLDGEVHRGFKSLIDQNQKIVLDKRWGNLLRFIKQEDDRIWNGSDNDCLKQLKEKIEPILRKSGFII